MHLKFEAHVRIVYTYFILFQKQTAPWNGFHYVPRGFLFDEQQNDYIAKVELTASLQCSIKSNREAAMLPHSGFVIK
jgi:hypothetical protein